jgi:ketosteroid isomerase-like protein
MSQANMERVQEVFAGVAAPEEFRWDRMHEDIEVHDHDVIDAGEYRGHAGLRRWFEDWSSAWAEFSTESEEMLDAGERVVAVFRLRAKGRGSGAEVERQDAMVFEVRDGKIWRIDYYNNRQQALEAVGLAE